MRELRDFEKEQLLHNKSSVHTAPTTTATTPITVTIPGMEHLAYPPPNISKFCGNESDIFETWLDEFSVITTRYPIDLQLSYVISNLSSEALMLYKGQPTDIQNYFSKLCTALSARFCDRRSILEKQDTLYSTKQFAGIPLQSP